MNRDVLLQEIGGLDNLWPVLAADDDQHEDLDVGQP